MVINDVQEIKQDEAMVNVGGGGGEETKVVT